jgi:membrane protease YdiL (CAAX protease family)
VPELEKAHKLKPNNRSAKITLFLALFLTSQYRSAANLFPTLFALGGGGLGISYVCGLLALLALSFKKRAATAPGLMFSFAWFFVFFEGQIAGVLLAGLFLPAYKTAVMLNAGLWVCALPLVFAAFAGFVRQPWGEPFLLRFPWAKTVGLCVLAAVFLALADLMFERTTTWLFGKPLSEQYIVPFLKEAFADAPWLTGIAVVLLSPVAEEILFRGLFYGALAHRFKPIWVIFITSAAFALVHMQLIYLVPLFIVGLVLGWARDKTGSLTAPILIHGLNNALALLILHFAT